MNNLKLWPHLTIIAVVCAVLAGVGVAMWMKHEQTVSAESLPGAARIERVDGDVALNNSVDNTTAQYSDDGQWINATQNQPVSVGDRIYTRDDSRASLAFTGRNYARLNPNTSLDVLTLADRRTQLALRDGSAMFDVGYLGPGELFEVATPYGAVDFEQPGLYNVGIDNGSAVVSVLSGLAQVAGLAGSGQISKGEVLTLLGQSAANVVLSRLNGNDAGYLVDDYYSYQYPAYYDGRYRDYNTYLSDPYYFDPYRRDVSYQYVNQYIPGLNDLDYYGNWQNLDGYGYAWSPHVDNSWSPYQQGYWMNDYPYGPTWVSSEPWGYAPYHYGRWAFVGNRWYWVPGTANQTPSYSPALVAFVPLNQNDIGWVPLGPSDSYLPRYYNAGWEPRYLSRTDVIQQQLANLYVPGAVNVLPVDEFGRYGNGRRGWRADRRSLDNVRPVLDPLTLTPLRNAVLHSAWGRGKKDLPPGIAKKLRDTTVLTSTLPIAPPFRRDLSRHLRVEAVNAQVRNRRFNVTDERNDRTLSRFPQAARELRNERVRDVRSFEEARNRGQQQRIDRAMERMQAERADNFRRQQVETSRAKPGNGQGRGQFRQDVSNSFRRQPEANRAKPGNGQGRGQFRQDVSPVPAQRTHGRGAKDLQPVREPGPPVREVQSSPRANPGKGGGRDKQVQGPPQQRAAESKHGGGHGKGKKP